MTPDQNANGKQDSPREKSTVKDHVETAKDVKDFFAKDEENVVHCSKCVGAQKAEWYSKAATAFSLGAFAVAAVSLGMQILSEPSSVVRFNDKEWTEFMDQLEKIVPASSSSSSQAAVVPVGVPASSRSKPAVGSSVKSSTAPVSSSTAQTSSVTKSSASSSADAVVPVEPAPADTGTGVPAEPAPADTGKEVPVEPVPADNGARAAAGTIQ